MQLNKVQYTVVIKDKDANLGPGKVVKVIENPHSLGWSEYVNDVGEAFFTIMQDDPKSGHPLLDSNEGPPPDENIWRLQDMIINGYHMEIYRNGEKVWGGWIGESDETNEDTIVYGYSYASGLYSLLSDWDQEWTATDVHTIISDLWTRAKTTLSDSPLAWVTTGTIQSLWSTEGGPTTLQMPFYNIFRKRILLAMKELTAYAISDTNNKVVFEITPDGTFNLWRNLGTTLFKSGWSSMSTGNIRSFHRVTKPVDRRTDLYAVGSSPNDIDLQHTESIAGDRSFIGRREEPIYLQWVRDQTELERVAAIRMKRAAKVDTDLSVSFFPDTIIPYRATGAKFTLTDDIWIALRGSGVSDVSEIKTIVGQQVIFHRNAESVKLILEDND